MLESALKAEAKELRAALVRSKWRLRAAAEVLGCSLKGVQCALGRHDAVRQEWERRKPARYPGRPRKT